jgi:hypothetical protein
LWVIPRHNGKVCIELVIRLDEQIAIRIAKDPAELAHKLVETKLVLVTLKWRRLFAYKLPVDLVLIPASPETVASHATFVAKTIQRKQDRVIAHGLVFVVRPRQHELSFSREQHESAQNTHSLTG